MDINGFDKVCKIKTLRRFRESEAREILENIAKQVQPIMHKRKWIVNILSEFCPGNPSLLGLNVGGGAEVNLRLRRPENELDFFPYNQILDTMLHELCHIEYGPHNTHFYNLLDEIRKECKELMVKGITGTGQGCDIPGICLGGFSHQPPLSSLHQRALAAADDRVRCGSLSPSGTNCIGGDRCNVSASMTAEGRLHVEVWCGSKSSESEGPSERFKDTAFLEDGSTQSSSLGSTPSPGTTDVTTMWQCSTCTLLNQPVAVICDACGTQKQGVSKIWSCKFCSLKNSTETEKCLVCRQWRYSYGPPASSRGSNVGT